MIQRYDHSYLLLLVDLLVATGILTVTRHTFLSVFCTLYWRSEFLSHIVTKVQTSACPSSSTLLHSVLMTHPYVRSYSHHTYLLPPQYSFPISRQYWRDHVVAPLTPYNWRACWCHILACSTGTTYGYSTQTRPSFITPMRKMHSST